MGTPHPAAQYFMSARPPAVELPHLLTALDADLIGMVSRLTGVNPGLWNEPAPYDDDNRYDEVRETASLAAWGLPPNQAEIRSFSPRVQEAVFGSHVMLVDAEADPATLARLAVTPGARDESGAWMVRGYEDLPELPELLTVCQWALIPVGPERSRALFVVDGSRADWIAQLAEWCARDRKSVV